MNRCAATGRKVWLFNTVNDLRRSQKERGKNEGNLNDVLHNWSEEYDWVHARFSDESQQTCVCLLCLNVGADNKKGDGGVLLRCGELV